MTEQKQPKKRGPVKIWTRLFDWIRRKRDMDEMIRGWGVGPSPRHKGFRPLPDDYVAPPSWGVTNADSVALGEFTWR